MTTEPSEDLRDKIQGELANVLNDHDGTMIAKYILIVDAIDTDGQRSLWYLLSPDLMTWDAIGMVEFVRGLQLRNTLFEELVDEDEDEMEED